MSGYSNKGIVFFFFSLGPTNITKNSQQLQGSAEGTFTIYNQKEEVQKTLCNLMEDKFQGLKGYLGV